MKLNAVLLAAVVFAVGTAQAAIRTAFFPPVPESWTQEIEGKAVVYKSPVVPKVQPEPLTQVRFTYSKATNGQDALSYAQDFIKKNSCTKAVEQGKGFYTTSCSTLGEDAVIIGEPDNMYLIEISGEYTNVAMDMINGYLNSIVKGKRTFNDRDIGEKDYDRTPPAPVAV